MGRRRAPLRLTARSAGWIQYRLNRSAIPWSIFHYFPISRNLALLKCRQFSVLGLTRGSLEAPILPLNYARSLSLIIARNKFSVQRFE